MPDLIVEKVTKEYPLAGSVSKDTGAVVRVLVAMDVSTAYRPAGGESRQYTAT